MQYRRDRATARTCQGSIRIEAFEGTHASTRAGVEEYDLMILGGGTEGTVAAWTFATQGQRVAVIERKYIGGNVSKKLL
jgi:ribulose 1,5-bisphosphate synthetase/thiazole synthase